MTVATALYPLTARLQHACGSAANLAPVRCDEAAWTLRMEAVRAIEEGEELFFCYSPDRERLKQQYGFECACASCAAAA